MELILDTKALNSTITRIGQAGAKLDAAIWQAGASALAIVNEHGQTGPANKLLGVMPNGSRRERLIEWMTAFGKLRKAGKAKQAEGIFVTYDKEGTGDTDGAVATPWYDYAPAKPETVKTEWDAQKAAMALLKRFKGVEAGVTITHKAEAIEALKALIQSLEA